MIGMGFVENWTTLAGLRIVLGLFEAGFFPGATPNTPIQEEPGVNADFVRQDVSTS